MSLTNSMACVSPPQAHDQVASAAPHVSATSARKRPHLLLEDGRLAVREGVKRLLAVVRAGARVADTAERQVGLCCVTNNERAANMQESTPQSLALSRRTPPLALNALRSPAPCMSVSLARKPPELVRLATAWQTAESVEKT